MVGGAARLPRPLQRRRQPRRGLRLAAAWSPSSSSARHRRRGPGRRAPDRRQDRRRRLRVVGRTATNGRSTSRWRATTPTAASIELRHRRPGHHRFQRRRRPRLRCRVQPDGRIVVAGHAGFDAPSARTTTSRVARYTATAALDASFGTGGKLAIDIGRRHRLARNVALQADGEIVVSGRTRVAGDGGVDHPASRAYGTNGSLDTSFGGGGKLDARPATRRDDGLALAGRRRDLVAGSVNVGDFPARSSTSR